MTQLRLPSAVRSAIRGIVGLDQSAVEELGRFLNANLEILLNEDEVYSRCGSLKSIAQDDAFRILDALVPWIFGVLSSATDPKAALDDLVRALVPSEGDPKLSRSEEKRLKTSLAVLVLDPRTLLKSKSVRLMTTHANTFAECEVVSDIRPVFSTDGKVEPEAAVTCHTLRIGYASEGERGARGFFVALDAKDLQVLKKAIDRAIAKEQALEKIVGKSGLFHVKVS